MPEWTSDAVSRTPATPDEGSIEELLGRIARLEEAVGQMGPALQGHAAWLADLQRGTADVSVAVDQVGQGLASVSVAVDGLGSSVPDGVRSEMDVLRTGHDRNLEWLKTLERWVRSCVRTLAQVGAQPLGDVDGGASGPPDVSVALWARFEMLATMQWIEDVATVDPGPVVSVVIASIDRPEVLQAVASVLAQSYPVIDLVVVDDSPDGGVAARLAGVHDSRLRIVRSGGRKPGAAFNVGLGAVRGDIVCALDDDNVMHRHWLRSVVWAFARRPDVDALFGARINEDPGATDAVPSGMPPTLEFQHYDRGRHERANFVDRNTIAFRAAHRGIRYDESLPAAIDWDHSLRLFAVAPPLALPALACYYRTLVVGRRSDGPLQSDGVRTVRSRAHTTRPLRVHVHTEMYPVISETYITEDILTMEDCGAVVTVSALEAAASVAADAPPCRLDYEAAITEADADVVLMHWATHAEVNLALMERLEVPFACRVHTFDVDAGIVRRLLEHPLCVAVFAHPHHVAELPVGVQPIIPVVGPRTVIPESPARRSLMLSVSAGLPKKQFPLIIEAMARLPEQERLIIVARTNGVLELPEEVQRLAAERDPRIQVRVNVPRTEALEAMAQASVALYTLDSEWPMGYPMSIVEAMLCGAIVVAPDREEAHGIVGEHLRTYRDVDDIVGHVRAVAMGGPGIDAARRALRERAQRHRDPATCRFLHDALSDALTAWKLARG